MDASQSIEEVKEELATIVTDTIQRVQGESVPLCRMWGGGEYELPVVNKAEAEDVENS